MNTPDRRVEGEEVEAISPTMPPWKDRGE